MLKMMISEINKPNAWRWWSRKDNRWWKA